MRKTNCFGPSWKAVGGQEDGLMMIGPSAKLSSMARVDAIWTWHLGDLSLFPEIRIVTLKFAAHDSAVRRVKRRQLILNASADG